MLGLCLGQCSKNVQIGSQILRSQELKAIRTRPRRQKDLCGLNQWKESEEILLLEIVKLVGWKQKQNDRIEVGQDLESEELDTNPSITTSYLCDFGAITLYSVFSHVNAGSLRPVQTLVSCILMPLPLLNPMRSRSRFRQQALPWRSRILRHGMM